jgi:hypothetical protein
MTIESQNQDGIRGIGPDIQTQKNTPSKKQRHETHHLLTMNCLPKMNFKISNKMKVRKDRKENIHRERECVCLIVVLFFGVIVVDSYRVEDPIEIRDAIPKTPNILTFETNVF